MVSAMQLAGRLTREDAPSISSSAWRKLVLECGLMSRARLSQIDADLVFTKVSARGMVRALVLLVLWARARVRA